MIRFILALAILGLTMWFLARLGRLGPAARAHFLRRSAIWGAVGLVVLLVATGRAPWFFAIIAGAIPWIQRLSMMKTLYDTGRRWLGLSTSTPSTIETRYLRVQLDPRTGKLSGTVMDGPQIGRTLDEMQRAELFALLKEIEINDEDSKRLLESYIESRFSDWASSEYNPDAALNQSSMSEEEALAVLGLSHGATESEIQDAHRRLMLKLHPDRGGVDWLATKINQAKDRLTKNSPTA